jgi:battenin
MVASAKSISEGGTALVFLSNSLPSLMVKLSAPYWFDRVSYDTRMKVACALMIAAFAIVASFASVHHTQQSLYMQLLGCVFVSVQCGMGEASLLALAGKYDVGREKNPCLTAFSSGTGLAGVFGFTWNFVWMNWLGLPLNSTLYLGNVLAILYYGLYYKCVREFRPGVVVPLNLVSGVLGGEFGAESSEPIAPHNNTDIDCRDTPVTIEFEDEADEPSIATSDMMTSLERFIAVLRLWPYMIPLFVVYAAEYSLQAGTWTAIGFPVDNETARDQFYEYSNWMVWPNLMDCMFPRHCHLTHTVLHYYCSSTKSVFSCPGHLAFCSSLRCRYYG